MSKLKVTTISDPDNDNTALTIDSSGNVTAPQNTTLNGDLTVSGGFIPSTQLSHRNLIINGAMQVAQRGTSFTGLTSGMTYRTVDRFGGNSYNVGSHTYNEEQSTDAPSEFSFSRKFTWTTAQTTSTNTRNQMRHHIEYENMRHLKWGTSDAKPATLSFWVKSSVTGLHPFSLVSGGETDSFVTNYTVNVANTWEYKTISIPAPTSGTFNASTIGIRMAWDFGSGDNHNAPSADSWVSGWYFRTSSSIRVAETTNATWQITGVQLEVGSVATPFEHRSYGEQLQLCFRYFYSTMFLRSANSLTAPTNNAPQIFGARHRFADVTGYRSQDVQHPVPMRASPSITFYNPGNSGTSGQFELYSHDGNSQNFSGFITANRETSFIFAGYTGVSVGTGGYSTVCFAHWKADAEL